MCTPLFVNQTHTRIQRILTIFISINAIYVILFILFIQFISLQEQFLHLDIENGYLLSFQAGAQKVNLLCHIVADLYVVDFVLVEHHERVGLMGRPLGAVSHQVGAILKHTIEQNIEYTFIAPEGISLAFWENNNTWIDNYNNTQIQAQTKKTNKTYQVR